jgi:lipoate-protein ligase A
MSRVLKVPDEKFRDKIHKNLKTNLSTIRRELGEDAAAYWDEDTLNNLLAIEFEKISGPMVVSDKDDRLEQKMRELRARMMNDEWLHRKGKRRVTGRDIKIREGINIHRRVHKAPGGLIRADFEVIGGKFGVVSISGDFFCYPDDAIGWLEAELEGHATDDIGPVIETFCSKNGIETPGIDVAEWVKVLTGN